MAVLVTQFQFLDNNGNPLDSGKIYTYEAGSSTPATTYQDANEVTANANPVVLDSAGRPPGSALWLDSSQQYKLVIKDSDDVTIQTIDNVSAGGNLFAAGIQLGGNLDVDNYSIVSNSNKDINITPHGTGDTNIKNAVLTDSFTMSVNLDLGGYDLIVDDGQSIIDENSNEQLTFNTTSSAVNNFAITNEAVGSHPLISTVGDDTDINFRIAAKGSGTIELESPTAISSLLEIDGTSSSAAELRLYEDTDNGTNYVSIKSPSSLSSDMMLTLPEGTPSANDILLSSDTSGTLQYASDNTSGFLLPKGTTAQRSEVEGTVRYNTTTNALEYYNGTNWLDFINNSREIIVSVDSEDVTYPSVHDIDDLDDTIDLGSGEYNGLRISGIIKLDSATNTNITAYLYNSALGNVSINGTCMYWDGSSWANTGVSTIYPIANFVSNTQILSFEIDVTMYNDGGYINAKSTYYNNSSAKWETRFLNGVTTDLLGRIRISSSGEDFQLTYKVEKIKNYM